MDFNLVMGLIIGGAWMGCFSVLLLKTFWLDRPPQIVKTLRELDG